MIDGVAQTHAADEAVVQIFQRNCWERSLKKAQADLLKYLYLRLPLLDKETVKPGNKVCSMLKGK